MRRLALLLAASTLGAGCTVSTDDGGYYCVDADRTMTIEWPSFLLANGAQADCRGAGVAYVDIYMNDQRVQGPVSGGWNCGDGGATITYVPAGTHLVTVEGIAADGSTILLRDERSVTPYDCGDTRVPVQPAEGTFDLAYSFTPTNVCTAGSYMFFSVYDAIAGTIAAQVDETSANPALYACGDPITFVLPAGAFTLTRTEESVYSGGAWLPTAANCNATSFNVTPAALSTVSVPLADSSAFCPARTAAPPPARRAPKGPATTLP
ncbi:hypothetical protein [Anaeromyxobacter dehalogenans]|uniref:Lipoprotein n=1 Tax=Anaeromyxobacter dehalogenans (strain 2CP-C) TaxID=290397 RepID=Q2INQ4_ANADE|nr:hypothetical protein [Anaeromyxobacter dehalogenans]ABC80439.1 hypothetical protein Adeh_0663 [Anaeromyxobacter dehalogenans 2CP-C]